MTIYKDHIVANPDKYDITNNPDGTVTLRPTYLSRPSEIIQQGTPVDAALVNGITSQLAEIALNVNLFGATSDGTTNDTAAVQAAIDHAEANGIKNVLIPKNTLYDRYALVFSSVVIIDDSGVSRQTSDNESWDLSNNNTFNFAGHRGLLSLYPESTIPAFKNSITNGHAHSVELDLRHSSDNEIYVLHDKTVDRTTSGTGAIIGLTSSYIDPLDAGAKFHPVYAQARVPKFSTLLSVLRGLDDLKMIYPQVNVMEIQDANTRKMLLETIIGWVKTYNLYDKTVLMLSGAQYGSSWHLSQEVRAIDSRIKIGFMIEPTTATFNNYLNLAKLDRNCIIGADKSLWLTDTTASRRAKREGIDTLAWTVNSAEEVEQLRKAFVYNIVTDVNLMGVK